MIFGEAKWNSSVGTGQGFAGNRSQVDLSVAYRAAMGQAATTWHPALGDLECRTDWRRPSRFRPRGHHDSKSTVGFADQLHAGGETCGTERLFGIERAVLFTPA